MGRSGNNFPRRHFGRESCCQRRYFKISYFAERPASVLFPRGRPTKRTHMRCYATVIEPFRVMNLFNLIPQILYSTRCCEIIVISLFVFLHENGKFTRYLNTISEALYQICSIHRYILIKKMSPK